MTPITNAQGYYHNRSEERTYTGLFADINRDFPYNRIDNNCFVSAASRAIFKIFQNNLIYGYFTYHGGTEVIGYPGGSYNHLNKGFLNQTSTEAPDDRMFDRISKIMQRQAKVPGWSDFATGSMSNTVYPGYGAMEDWAYGASWDTSSKARSTSGTPASYRPLHNSDYFSKFESIKPSIYLIEASDRKIPLEKNFGNKDIYGIIWSSNGHINRHLRLILSFLDLMKVYPAFNSFKLIKQDTFVKEILKFNRRLTFQKVQVQNIANNNFDTIDL